MGWWSAVPVAALVALVAVLYVGVDDGHGFQALETYAIDGLPWSELPKERDEDDLLQKAEARFHGELHGPESIAFDPHGKGPYTGLADGRVVFWNGRRWVDFAFTSPHRSELCDPKSSPQSYSANEHICGRPLGLRFENRTGDLYIADAYFGILKVGPRGGLATQITTEAEGVPFRFTNDLDVDDQGNIYFTDSSSNFQRRNFLQLIISAEPSGRLLKYNATTGETTVLLRGLQFPNGVTLSGDGAFLVFCEGCRGRLTKYWLRGKKAGRIELVAVLPGFPDNVRRSEDGNFWVAIHRRFTLVTHLLGRYPRVRRAIVRLPISTVLFRRMSSGSHHAMIMKYDGEGKLLKVMEDRDGKVVRAVSEVEEKDGKLWLGSVLMPFIAVY